MLNNTEKGIEGPEVQGKEKEKKSKVCLGVTLANAAGILALLGYSYAEKKGWVTPVIEPSIDKIVLAVEGASGSELRSGCIVQGGINVKLRPGDSISFATGEEFEWDGEAFSGSASVESGQIYSFQDLDVPVGSGWTFPVGPEIVRRGKDEGRSSRTIIHCQENKGKGDTFAVWDTETLKIRTESPSQPTQAPVRVVIP